MDLPSDVARTAIGPPGDPRAGPAPRTGEPDLGPPQDPGRTDRAGLPGRGRHRLADPAPRRCRSRTAAGRCLLADVSARERGGDTKVGQPKQHEVASSRGHRPRRARAGARLGPRSVLTTTTILTRADGIFGMHTHIACAPDYQALHSPKGLNPSGNFATRIFASTCQSYWGILLFLLLSGLGSAGSSLRAVSSLVATTIIQTGRRL